MRIDLAASIHQSLDLVDSVVTAYRALGIDVTRDTFTGDNGV
jgi:hypothetical protein